MYFHKFLPAAAISFLVFPVWADGSLESGMLSHVEKILVIDSINVNREAFLDHYRIQPSAGSLLSSEDVATRLKGTILPEFFTGEPSTGFTNEYEDYLIWAQKDSTGYLRLAESYRLVNGEWETPQFTPTVLNFGTEMPDTIPVDANAAYPFMTDDGQSLYFAADNDKSLGGFDIFIATKDPSDGSFLIPGNIGMPFNSTYDDYMMVLDRQTGVGWWASDRNQLEDEITIYIYALTDKRINVNPDNDDLPIYATLSGWQSTIDEEGEAARQKFLSEISNIKKTDKRTPEFELAMPGGQTYRFFSDFKNKGTTRLMRNYLSSKRALVEAQDQLQALRRKYNEEGGQNLGTRIQTLEQDIRKREQSLQTLLSDIYRSEDGK